jgi:DnaK suppressor protein
MEEAEINGFRERLLRLKSELEGLEETSREATRPVELDQSSVGRLSRMDAMQVQAMARETARRRQRQRAGIEGALRRIESGDYGFCFVCGEAIDTRRLAADPTTTRCLACMEDT